MFIIKAIVVLVCFLAVWQIAHPALGILTAIVLAVWLFGRK